MRKQSDRRPEPSAVLQLWTYEAALSAVPYLCAVVRSLREHWLHVQSVRRQIQRLDSRPGQPDRQTLIRRAVAVKELDQADMRLEEAFDEPLSRNEGINDGNRGSRRQGNSDRACPRGGPSPSVTRRSAFIGIGGRWAGH